MFTRVFFLLGAVLATSFCAAWAKAGDLEVKNIKTESGNEYTVFYQGDLAAAFDTKRPKQTDKSILLCIPCAFTSYVGSIDGAYVCDGKVHHRHFVSDQFGGAGLIKDGSIELISTGKGKLLTKEYLNDLAKRRLALFQQFLIVENGQPSHFKDKTLFQRRAIAKFKDGQTGVVESKAAITLTQFGHDLKDAGARYALYTDMGTYDEGWYRDAGDSIKPLGLDRSMTSKQTNWLTFHKRNGAANRVE